MKIGITYGTFDLFHIGHLNLLRRASERCDRLHVGVSTDTFNEIKGKTCVASFQDRIKSVERCEYVYGVFPENDWEQKTGDIKSFGVGVLFMGADWAGKFDHLSAYCEVCYLQRTPGISSTQLRETMKLQLD